MIGSKRNHVKNVTKKRIQILIDQQQKLDEINKRAREALDDTTVTTEEMDSDDDTAAPQILDLPEDEDFELEPIPAGVNTTPMAKNSDSNIITQNSEDCKQRRQSPRLQMIQSKTACISQDAVNSFLFNAMIDQEPAFRPGGMKKTTFVFNANRHRGMRKWSSTSNH